MNKESEMDTSPPEGAEPQPSGSKGPRSKPPSETESEKEKGKGKPVMYQASPRYFQVKPGAITVYGTGDSHLRRGNGFPEAFAQARANGEVDHRFSAVNRKVAWETRKNKYAEGYRFSEAYLGQLLSLLEESQGKATALFLSIGTNDLREAKVEEREETLQSLFTRFQTLMDKVKETYGVVLYILEPIPCDKGIEEFRDRLDGEIEKKCREHERTRYVSLTRGKEPLLTKINGRYYRKPLWKDDRHFSPEGAELIVKALANAFRGTRSDYFLVDPLARKPRPAPGNSSSGGAKGKSTRPQDKKPYEQREIREGRVEKRTVKIDTGRVSRDKLPVRDRLGGKFAPRDKTPPRSEKVGHERPDYRYYQDQRQKARKLYNEMMDRIEEAERRGELIPEEEEVTGPPPPTCRPYQEPPRWNDFDPRGGGFGGYRGYGGYGTHPYYGPPPPPSMPADYWTVNPAYTQNPKQ